MSTGLTQILCPELNCLRVGGTALVSGPLAPHGLATPTLVEDVNALLKSLRNLRAKIEKLEETQRPLNHDQGSAACIRLLLAVAACGIQDPERKLCDFRETDPVRNGSSWSSHPFQPEDDRRSKGRWIFLIFTLDLQILVRNISLRERTIFPSNTFDGCSRSRSLVP